jgi:hypothetical protein
LTAALTGLRPETGHAARALGLARTERDRRFLRRRVAEAGG